MKFYTLLFSAILSLICTAQATVQPASMFGDHMVLQREMPVPIWGTAEPGEKISVTFGDASANGIADQDGKWMVTLPALKASDKGRELTIKGSTTVTIKDVLVGEVWICSGQSNMQYGWGKESHPMFNWGKAPGLPELAEEAKTLPIRCFNVIPDVSFTENDSCQGEWSTQLPGSAVAFGFSYHLQKALNIPVAVIVTCWGSSSIEGWMPLDMKDQLPHFKEMMTRFDGADSEARKKVEEAQAKGISHKMVFVRKQPNLLYNAMLHPVIPYASRGFIWYQGEANGGQPDQYKESFPLWLKRIRKEWNQDSLHFMAVMLPGFGKDNGHPESKSWAQFRDAQMSILNEPNTAVANTIDLGDVKNIHPPDKAPIAERLSLLARSNVYGEEIVHQGPLFEKASVDSDKMVITFKHAEGLKTRDQEAPRGFWLSDKEGKWHEANASIKGETIMLSAEGVESPTACRYAWAGKPDVNLVNKASLPAYPFKTDSP